MDGIGWHGVKQYSPFFLLLTLLLAGCGGGGPRIDARVLQLQLAYSIDGPTAALVTGGDGAASAGSDVECRLTGSGRPQVGASVANDTGAFEMQLDLNLLPQQLPDAETFEQLNESIECRSGSGSWEHPLRQPVLRVE